MYFFITYVVKHFVQTTIIIEVSQKIKKQFESEAKIK
jgi:hypothetical protein